MSKLFTLLAAALLCGCGGSNYTLTGRLGGEPGDSLFLLSTCEGDSVLASGRVDADTLLRLEGRVGETVLASLVDAERNPVVRTLFVEPGAIRIGNGGVLSGTPLNDSLRTFDSLCRAATSPDALMLLRRGMIRSNADNLFGVYLFAACDEFRNSEQRRDIFSVFSSDMQRHLLLTPIREELAAEENTAVGKPYMDLELNDVWDQPAALSGLVGQGQWVLLDFWAAWCSTCTGEIPFLREAYAAYQGRGFGIYGVSLDNDIDRWRSFVQENELPWVNVSGLDASKRSPAAARYGVRSLPANFLLSPEGIIVAKNLYGAELRTELAKHIR